MILRYSHYRPVPRFYNLKYKVIKGTNCRLTNTLFDCGARITIGKNVFFGHDCMVLTGIHDYTLKGKARKDTVRHKPVVFKDGCWIASGCIIMPGVTIGENAVVGAGSLVTHNIPANEMWFGSPAKFHKKI